MCVSGKRVVIKETGRVVGDRNWKLPVAVVNNVFGTEASFPARYLC